MGKSSSAKQQVTDYYLSYHGGVCLRADKLLSIVVREKEAWTGEVTSEAEIEINKPNLFGGVKKEGGVKGFVRYMPGGATQVMQASLAAKLGKTSATCPGYRGLVSLFFYGGTSSSGQFWNPVSTLRGFLWGSNNPYLGSIWVKVAYAPKALASHLRSIGPDANPAAIIYECLTDVEFLGHGADVIDIDSFTAAAETLLDEEFGLSTVWMRQTTVEAFISEILDHILATLYINPRNGKFTLKLIRGDYVIEDLPELNPDNSNLKSWDRKSFYGTINEVVATWTNPKNEQEETVTEQDLGNITIQQDIVSDSRNYYMIRNSGLAVKVAKRDVAQTALPLAVGEIEINRSGWYFVPGGCARLNYPDDGIENVVVRLGRISYGKLGDETIKANITEDIFALPISAYAAPDDPSWEDPSSVPTAMDHVKVITAPAYFCSTNLTPAEVANFEYPEALAAVLATQDAPDVLDYELIGETTLPSGQVIGEILGTKDVLGYAELPVALDAEAETLLASFGTITGIIGPIVSGFVFIGDVDEAYSEIALITARDETGWTLSRGVLDTVPRAWPADTPVWFAAATTSFLDLTIRAEGETVSYKTLPRTSQGTLAEADSAIFGITLSGRPHLPNRPANVTIAGVQFGSVDYSAGSPTVVPVSWARRNRLFEDNIVLPWSDGDVTPEAGQTTTIEIIKPDGTVLTTHDGLSGTNYDVPIASFDGEAIADVRVSAKRDGLQSLQGAVVRVRVSGAGSIPDPDPPPPPPYVPPPSLPPTPDPPSNVSY